MHTLPALSLLLTTLLTSTTTAHPASTLHERELLQCGPTTYSPDDFSCANPSTGQVIARLPHGTDGSPLPTPLNQPTKTAAAYATPLPAPAGQYPHEGTVSVDNGGSGSGSGNGNGGSGSGGGGERKMMRRQQEVQTLPHGVGGSEISGGGQQQQQPQSGDGSVPAGVDPSLGRVHVDGNGGGNGGGD